jgi:hypothetical protein
MAGHGSNGQAIARLQQGTSPAATTLLKIMIDPSVPPSVRVRAADSVLNHATKAIEIEEIEARVAALEQAASPGGAIGTFSPDCAKVRTLTEI